METTALAVVEPQEAVSLLESPLSPAETAEYEADMLAIELAGKDQFEKALIIGQRLSNIYNNCTFREAARLVPKRSEKESLWERWLRGCLPDRLPEAEGRSSDWGDRRRLLWEERHLLSSCSPARALPASQEVASALTTLVPRKFSGPAGWNPAILDDPDAAQGLAKVWELACMTAKLQGKKDPNAYDVRAAREELRPELERDGLIRSAPASFQAATAARVEAARQRTVDVTPANADRFKETMAKIRETKAERTAKVEVDHVREQLDAADRKQRQTLEQEVRTYNARLHDASKAIHELLGYLQTLSRTHGTQFLDEMRRIDVLGLITVKDDMPRLKEMGQELMAAVRLAQSSEPSTGINVQTVEL
jgi:hypothetical protein